MMSLTEHGNSRTGWKSWLPLETAEKRLEAQGRDSSKFWCFPNTFSQLSVIRRPGTFWAFPGVVWWAYRLLELLQKPWFTKVVIPTEFVKAVQGAMALHEGGMIFYDCTGQCSRMPWGPVPRSLRMQWALQYCDALCETRANAWPIANTAGDLRLNKEAVMLPDFHWQAGKMWVQSFLCISTCDHHI